MQHNMRLSTYDVPDARRVPGCDACKRTRTASLAHSDHMRQRYAAMQAAAEVVLARLPGCIVIDTDDAGTITRTYAVQ